MNKPSSPNVQRSPARARRRSDPTSVGRARGDAPAVKAIVAATAAALLLLPQAREGHAQVIGEIDVRSRLGETFFAAVPVQSERALDPNCIQVSRNPSAPAGADPLSGTRVRINPTGAVEAVIIETAGAVASPVVGLRLQVGCVNPVVRDFVVRGDAVPAAEVAPQAPVATAPAPVPARARAPRAAAPRVQAQAAGPRATTPQAAAAQPRVAIPQPPRVQPPARGEDMAKAPVVTGHSSASAIAPARTTVPASPTDIANQEAQKRIAELRARSDDHAANLLALEDRLSILQKQAELLKAQLEQTTAAPATDSRAAAAPAAAVEHTAAGVVSGVSAPAPVASLAAPASEAKVRSAGDVWTDWRVLGGALGGLLIAALAYGFGRRRTVEPEDAAPSTTMPAARRQPLGGESRSSAAPVFERTQQMAPAATIPEAERTAEWSRAAQPLADETAQWDVRPPTTTTMPVPEGVPQSAVATQPGIGITRDFHITQQFQPTDEREVALNTPEEIVHQARIHYMDDGDTFRAIDLLEMAVSVRSDSARPWQALFAIYRRESMLDRFQRLAVAYRQAFGEDENWPIIQGLGFAMDASNPLYAGAAGSAPIANDLLDRWLGVPLDFTAHLLANEMHDQLMETFPGRGKNRKRVSGE